MSKEESQIPKENHKFSFVRKSNHEYWIFMWRSWGAMLKTSAECEECGKTPNFYWGQIDAQGKESQRRLYCCPEHFDEVFRMVLQL